MSESTQNDHELDSVLISDAAGRARRGGQWTRIGFAVCLALLMATMAAALVSVEQSRRDAAWVAHSRTVRFGLRSVQAKMIEAESAKRGFLIMGDAQYIERYEAATAECELGIARLQEMLADHPARTRALAEIASRIAQRGEQMDQLIATHRHGGSAAALALLRREDPDAALASIGGVVEAMLDEESRLLDERFEAASRGRQVTVAAVVAGGALSMLTAGLSARSMRRDLAFRRRAHDALRASERRYRELAEAIDEVFWVVSPDGDEIQYVSPAYETIFARSCQSLYDDPSTWLEAVHEGDRGRVERDLFRCGPGASFETMYRIIRPDGEVRWVRDRGFPIRDERGEIERIVGITQDVTELTQAERALRISRDQLELRVRARTRDLERTNEELEQFAYAASHDLKTPVVTFIGFLNMLEKQLEDADDDGARDSIERMQRAAVRMQRLIDDLLEISRIGRVVQESEPVSVAGVAREFIEASGPMLEEAGVSVVVDEPAPVVFGDGTRLRQVMQNLLTNAVKYGCPDGGEIHVGGTHDDDETRFYVRDQGPGIDARYREKVFALFQRLDTSTEGTGVGLAIVRRAIECQGGRVWVESEPGEGATFWVALPSQAAVAVAA